MQRHAFRSVYSRARPELEQASDALQSCIRQFSTTQLQAADEPPRPSVQERRRAAASQVNSLAQERSTNPNAQAGKPNVIDVKKLPLAPRIRGLRGGFMGRGRGGLRGGASPSGPGRAPGGIASRGGARGGRGGRGGRGRGGAMRGRRSGPGEGKDRDDKARGSYGQFNQMSAEEEAFDKDLRFGVPTPYVQPAVTLESIAEFAPAFPSSAMGQAAAVRENLSVLGTADPIGAPLEFQARHLAADVEQNGLRFFADLKSKEAAEQYLQETKKPQAEGEEAEAEAEAASGPAIAAAEEAVRQTILSRAVQGQYEAPQFTDNTVAIARSWHLRAETYTTKDVNSFEKKVQSLLARSAAKGAAKPKAKAAKKAAKA